MNRWLGIGRLCGEPEVSYAQSGLAVARYRLAVNRDRKKDGQQEADFLNIVAFGKGAEFAQKYLHKGMKIAVEGRIQTGSYEKDGVKHYTTDIIAERQEFVERKGADTADAPATASPSTGFEAGFRQVEDDDLLPF